MGWPEDKFLRDKTAMIDKKLVNLQTDVEALKLHRQRCDEMHEQHKEFKKRSDDAMNNLTESNLFLAKSITDVNVTITKIAAVIERDEPDINALRNARIAFGVNKWIFATVVATAAGAAALMSFYKGFF